MPELRTFAATRPGILRQHMPTLTWARQVADVLAALAVLYAAAWYKLGGALPLHYQALAAVLAMGQVIVYERSGVYNPARLSSVWADTRGLLKGWVALLLLLFALGFATKTGSLYSREALGYLAVFGYGAQLVLHVAFVKSLHTLHERGHYGRRALLIGAGETAHSFAARLARNRWLGVRLVGYLSDDVWTHERSGGPTLSRLGNPKELGDVIARHDIHAVYIALPLDESRRIQEAMSLALPLDVSIHWVPDVTSFHLINHVVRDIEGQPVLTLSDSPVVGLGWLVKWLEDKMIAGLAMLLLSPVMLTIAIAIKLTSPGPVLFKQLRAGLNGRPINVYKFRSMVVHNEPPGQLTQATRDDPRVTRLGAFLRASSLDELPQFYNVLQGRMSIVGPRPHALEHDDTYQRLVESYMLRYRIKPGITGWAQVNGYRGEMDTLEKLRSRVEYDLYYINNWSLWFDLAIIFMTAVIVIARRNAY